MKLDRNINPDGRGKYALIKLRRQGKGFPLSCQKAAQLLKKHKLVDFGNTPNTEFFVIRLKDKFAAVALEAYAIAAFHDDPEYSKEVLVLARKAYNHPQKRMPD